MDRDSGGAVSIAIDTRRTLCAKRLISVAEVCDKLSPLSARVSQCVSKGGRMLHLLGREWMRSYAQGRVGDFAFKPTADGFAWEIPAGPVTIRYTATIKEGT
jgi:hypothetical protein